MFVDIPDATFRASIEDLLSISLHTYLGLLLFLSLIRDCCLDVVVTRPGIVLIPLDPDPGAQLDIMNFKSGYINIIVYNTYIK